MYSDLRSRKARWASREPEEVELGLFVVDEVEELLATPSTFPLIPPDAVPLPFVPAAAAAAAAVTLLDFLPGLAR